jgi:hypothetical protein
MYQTTPTATSLHESQVSSGTLTKNGITGIHRQVSSSILNWLAHGSGHPNFLDTNLLVRGVKEN